MTAALEDGWMETIDISQALKVTDFTGQKDAIVSAIQDSAWAASLVNGDRLDVALQRLADADSPTEANLALATIWDLADEERVHLLVLA